MVEFIHYQKPMHRQAAEWQLPMGEHLGNVENRFLLINKKREQQS